MAQNVTLTPEERDATGFTHKVIITAADVAALTSGTAVAIFPVYGGAATLPAGTYLAGSAWNVTTAFTFSSGDTGTLVAIVGDGGDTDRYVVSTTVKTAGPLVGPSTTREFIYTSADTIDAIFTAATQAITLVDAGVIEIYLKVCDLNALQRATK
jgi:hypothetical protein